MNSLVSLLEGTDSYNYPLAAIGCPGRVVQDNGQVYSGGAEIHALIFGIGWGHVASIDGGLGSNTRFGASLSLAEHAGQILLALGAPGTSSNEGRASVFRMVGGANTWTLDHVWSGSSGSQFGSALHLLGERLVVGAPSRRIPGPGPGGQVIQVPVGSYSVATRSCVFNPHPSPPSCNWGGATEFVGTIGVPASVEQHRLGHAVHILATGAAGRIVAGEPLWPVTSQTGRARHLMRINGSWELNQAEPFHGGALPAPSALGTSLAGNQAWLAIGAPGAVDPEEEEPRGRVLIYAFRDPLFQDRFE